MESNFTIKDSGQRQEFATGSRRDTDEGKPRLSLIPPLVLSRLAMVYTNGAKKYGDNNWQKGQPLSRYYDSAMRHMLAAREGREDEDHLFQAAWNMAAIAWTLEECRAHRLPESLVDLPFALPGLTSRRYDGTRVFHTSAGPITEEEAREIAKVLAATGSPVFGGTLADPDDAPVPASEKAKPWKQADMTGEPRRVVDSLFSRDQGGPAEALLIPDTVPPNPFIPGSNHRAGCVCSKCEKRAEPALEGHSGDADGYSRTAPHARDR